MKKNTIFLILISLLILSGCTNGESLVNEPVQDDAAIEVSGEDLEILRRSEDLSDYVVELYGIDDAVTIIFNDTAVVGVVLAYDQKMEKDIEEVIINTVKEKDNRIKDVKVSDNKRLFQDINAIIEALLNGKSYDNYVAEINRIIEKIDKDK